MNWIEITTVILGSGVTSGITNYFLNSKKEKDLYKFRQRQDELFKCYEAINQLLSVTSLSSWEDMFSGIFQRATDLSYKLNALKQSKLSDLLTEYSCERLTLAFDHCSTGSKMDVNKRIEISKGIATLEKKIRKEAEKLF